MGTPGRTHLCAAVLTLAAALCAGPLAAQDGDAAPLSAIDWLSRSVETTGLPGAAPLTTDPDEPPVALSATPPSITVTPLDGPSPDAVGLLGSEVTGLPRSLWSGSAEDVLSVLIRAERVETLPAMQELMVTLMLAEADPPLGAGPSGTLFLARVDKLLDLGALEPAQALLEAAGPDSPALFLRWFDVSLLTGTEDAACAAMQSRPALAPTYPARIFCLAREGDWTAAALTLNTARALEEITQEQEALLSRFLDPDLFEGMPPLPPPSRPSPLVFRMREAIGEGLPTAGLPLAFAHADLRTTSAWRNQIEAAERLARHGAISENVLQAAYTARTPAASGGVWDRAAAVQRFDTALDAGDAAAVAASLPGAWEAMQAARTEVPFATLYAEALSTLPLTGEAAALAYRIGLLSPVYEAAALARTPVSDAERLWQAVARGNVAGLTPDDPVARAIVAAFDGAPVPEPMASQIGSGQLGEALLRAISTFNQGLEGDIAALTDALAVLRAVGLEDVARRAALQQLLLDRVR